MTKIFDFALKIKGGGREGRTCEVLRPCHPPKIWNVHKLSSDYSLNTCFSRRFLYIDGPLFSPYKPLRNVQGR